MAARARAHRGGTVERVKEHWWDFRTGQPGRRFQDRYRRRRRQGHSLVAKFVSLGLGLVLLAIGLVMLPAPGPGFLIVFPGAALLAEESLWAAKAFDWMEVKLRALAVWSTRAWKRASLALKATAVVCALVLVAGAGLVAYAVLFG